MTMILRLLPLLAIALDNFANGLYSSNSKVLHVDAARFDSLVVKSELPVLVEFYAPWCGHCKNLVPIYQKVAKKLDGIVKVMAIDMDDEKNKKLGSVYGVTGFPTIILFKNGVPNKYEGQREKQPMLDFVKKALPSKVKRITSTTINDFLSKTATPRALLFMPNGDINMFFKALSVTLAGRMVFGQVDFKTSKDLFDKYSISGKSELLIFPAESVMPVKFDKKLGKNKSKLQTFILKYALPRDPAELKLPQLHDQSCFKAHCLDASSALCAIGISFSRSDFKKLESVNEASEASESNICRFSWIEGQKNPDLLASFGLNLSDQMKLVFFSPRKSRFALYSGDFTKESILSFIQDIIKGKVSVASVVSTPTLSDSTSKCSKKSKTQTSAKKVSVKDEL